MALKKSQAGTGRIVATIVPITTHDDDSLGLDVADHGHMAPNLGLRTLVCFYCNKKSGLKYDGLITRWDCGFCESENYLDENGDITDPPVATDLAAPGNLKFAVPRPESPASEPSSQSTPGIFCTTCLKNQHLYISCLRQYHVETDPTHPQYKKLEREYFKYRKGLELQYPQVCEDCESKVLERMKEAGKTAKTDYLRRLLERSRARRAAVRSSGPTLPGFLGFMGKSLWYFGLATQIIRHVTALAAIANHKYQTHVSSYISPTIVMLLPWLYETSIALSTWGLWSSVGSLWWNPKFKNLNNGFINHIKGFDEWYKYQAILLAFRCLSYYIMRTSVLADPFAPATTGAHMFGLCFVVYLSIAANRALKVDMAPLWNSVPEKLSHVGPGSPNSNKTKETMMDTLNEILATPTARERPITPPSWSSPNQHNVNSGRYSDQISPIQYPKPGNTQAPQQSRASSTIGFKNLSLRDLNSANGNAVLPAGNNVGEATPNGTSGNEDYDMMDWSPAQAPSAHRAFEPTRAVEAGKTLFGQAPAAQQSTFWYKVPQAPVAPAHRLRNPPNQPRLRVSSQEVKENFFKSVTRKPHGLEPPTTAQPSGGDRPKQEIEFTQQKFFPPSTPNETGEKLAELLTSFSLGQEAERPSSNTSRVHNPRHLWQALFLVIALIVWNQAFSNQSWHSNTTTLAIMAGCALLGTRTITDSVLSEKQGRLTQPVGIILGAAEFAAAVYGIQEISLGRGNCADCSLKGSILLLGMIGVEMWQV